MAGRLELAAEEQEASGEFLPMNMFYWAIIVLGAFIAIWILFVAPAERRHHERKLELLQKKIENRQLQEGQMQNNSSSVQNNDIQES